MPNEPRTPAPGIPASEAEFEAVVETYEGVLLRYAGRILGDTAAAQDIVQNAFIKLFLRWKIRSWPSMGVSAWLYRVTHNLAVDHVRRSKRHRDYVDREAEAARERRHPSPDDAGISDAADRAAALLKTLSLREQQLIVLKVYEGKTYREIAAITGLSDGNVGYILHFAMKKLAAALKADRTKQGQAHDT